MTAVRKGFVHCINIRAGAENMRPRQSTPARGRRRFAIATPLGERLSRTMLTDDLLCVDNHSKCDVFEKEWSINAALKPELLFGVLKRTDIRIRENGHGASALGLRDEDRK